MYVLVACDLEMKCLWLKNAPGICAFIFAKHFDDYPFFFSSYIAAFVFIGVLHKYNLWSLMHLHGHLELGNCYNCSSLILMWNAVLEKETFL